jgi:hypothetical protein
MMREWYSNYEQDKQNQLQKKERILIKHSKLDRSGIYNS